MKAWSGSVEVLPAAGGAQEDLLQLDAEEREERLNAEQAVFDTVYERDQYGQWWRSSLYRFTPPRHRTQCHLFRYFVDGSFRSYFLGTVLEHERSSSIHYAQIGACVLFRRDNGTVRKELLETRHLILVNLQNLSEHARRLLESLMSRTSAVLDDLGIPDPFGHAYGDFDMRTMAGGRVRYRMRELEAEVVGRILNKLNADCWLIMDGSLMFQPVLRRLQDRFPHLIPPVLGVSKSFRKDPQFVFGHGPRSQRFSIYSLLVGLKHEHRTPAFSACDGQVVFWYVRLRPQEHVDYPLMGVVKCELITANGEPVPTELVDLVSQSLVAERSVTPHGRDRRWHAHLYPIFLAEEVVRNALYSRDIVQQLMRWR